MDCFRASLSDCFEEVGGGFRLEGENTSGGKGGGDSSSGTSQARKDGELWKIDRNVVRRVLEHVG